MRSQLATFRNRANLVETPHEAWRPPLFVAPAGGVGLMAGTVRRFFDLQAGSTWRDVGAILPEVEGVVLDVGCGAQPYRPLLKGAAKYRAIDATAAKTDFGYAIPDTDYFEGEVWPVADSSVDFVLCTETLEHVLDTRRFLSEAHRCLVFGGRLLLTVPFAARWHFIPCDYWRFTPSGMNYLLTTTGFSEVEVYARGNAVTVACYKVMALILRSLMPQTSNGVLNWCLRLLGFATLPFLLLLACIANISLMAKGGDDCLGYTVLARKGSI